MSPFEQGRETTPIPKDKVELRLLTEVNQLLYNLDESGEVPLEVEAGVKQNLKTAISEISMPYAVNTTYHRVEHFTDEDGQRRRAITWLGKNAVELAMGGYDFAFSEAGRRRVEVEVNEAKHAEESLRSGVAEVFISPKMSQFDAPYSLAKDEHMADEDSIRVSKAVCDHSGNVVARQMQSLLVSDVPLSAWVKLLNDENNLFQKSFKIENDESALSVMQLFDQLELPEEALPDGPVNLVEAVVDYIDDDLARHKVKKQIKRFKADQALYEAEADKRADEWFDFELELARSLKQGAATYEISRFVSVLQGEWSRSDLEVVNRHGLKNGKYTMSDELAAVLENKKRAVLGGLAAVMTNNEKATAKLSAKEVESIQQSELAMQRAVRFGAEAEQIRLLEANRSRAVAKSNIKVGGGCAGNYSNSQELDSLNEPSLDIEKNTPEGSDSKENWKWKKGECQVKSCPSPKPTEVGPCSVCRRCQNEFDHGRDPSAQIVPSEQLNNTNESSTTGSLFGSEDFKELLAGLMGKKPERPKHLSLVK